MVMQHVCKLAVSCHLPVGFKFSLSVQSTYFQPQPSQKATLSMMIAVMIREVVLILDGGPGPYFSRSSEYFPSVHALNVTSNKIRFM